jgi:hypothetical protein
VHTTAASVGQQGMRAHIRILQNGKFTSLYMPLGGASERKLGKSLKPNQNDPRKKQGKRAGRSAT